MKVFLKGYTKTNLGDDLFFKVLLDRYSSNNKFYIVYNKKNRYLMKYKNLKMINNRITSKLERSFGIRDYYTRHYEKKCDITVKIGGSLFIERRGNKNQQLQRKVLHDEYIIGANFGPFYSNEFLEFYKKIYFPQMSDIYFRESYSYNLFHNLKNVRYGNDVIFSLNLDSIKITKRKRVIFSIIDVYKKVPENLAEKYFNDISDLINIFLGKNYEVLLMSFCKYEGDENAISIVEKKANKKLEKYFYDGNIDEALNILGDSQVVVGTRFHACILGFLMNKTVIPIAYSDKILNVLSDLNFRGQIFDIRKNEKLEFKNIDLILKNNKLDITKIKENTDNPFKLLDKVLERK